MIENQKIRQEREIKAFKLKFLREHNIKLFIITPKLDADHACTLEVYKKITLECIREDHPKYKKYTFKTKSKERDFVTYIQVMSFLASNDGYSLTAVGNSIFRNHATIINSRRIIGNGIETKEPSINRILKKIQTKIDDYVGIISEDIKSKPITEPKLDPIWYEAKDLITGRGNYR
jgi:hypothetical protein